MIQLAALCKVVDIQTFGYEKALGPLLRDLRTLEQDGVFIEFIGKVVQGTVMCVVSDNLAAHDLAGFLKSFRVEYYLEYCLGIRIPKLNFRLMKLQVASSVLEQKTAIIVMCML